MAKDDLSDAYDNVGHIPGGADYPDRWSEAARAYREREHAIGRARLNLAYGSGERQALDLFYPAGRPEGLLVFVHGGYWRRFDRSFWSHLAGGATAHGWAVAMPSYTLAPVARITAITQEIRQAIEFAATLVRGPIVLSGHSAGGHLVARMNCRDTGLDAATIGRIKRVVPISPVADLRPLMQTVINADLRLDIAEATAESPALISDRHGIATHVWVGANERPAFVDQSRWLDDAWAEAQLTIDPGKHHFDVIDGMEDADAPLTQAMIGDL